MNSNQPHTPTEPKTHTHTRENHQSRPCSTHNCAFTQWSVSAQIFITIGRCQTLHMVFQKGKKLKHNCPMKVCLQLRCQEFLLSRVVVITPRETYLYKWRNATRTHCTLVTWVHSPSTSSFHRVTLLLESDTAKMFPVSDQLTRHTGVLKSFNVNGCHWSPSLACKKQMMI